jgi:hypothetical protein
MKERSTLSSKDSRTPPLNAICALHFLARKVCSMQPLFYLVLTQESNQLFKEGFDFN